MIHVIAILTAKPSQRGALFEAFKANQPTVLKETGCIEYTAVIDVKDADPAFGSDTLVVIEKWASMEALSAHAVAPHMVMFGHKVQDILLNRAIHVLEAA